MVVDYRRLIQVTEWPYLITFNTDALKSALAGSKFISVGDLTDRFSQVSKEPETAQKMAVLYLPRGLAFGPASGPGEFQELVFIRDQVC